MSPDRFLPSNFPDLRGAACTGLLGLVDAAMDRPGGPAGEELKRLCSTCPVQRECLSWALEHGEHGVWGGTSPNVRTSVTRRDARGRRAPRAPVPRPPAARPAA